MPKQSKKKGIKWANNKGLPLHRVRNTHARQNYNRTPNVNMATLRLRRLGLHNQIPNYQRRQTGKNWENEQEALRHEAEIERNFPRFTNTAIKAAMNSYPKVSNESLNEWYRSFTNTEEPFVEEWNGTPRNGAAAPFRNDSGENEELGTPKNGGRRRTRKRRA